MIQFNDSRIEEKYWKRVVVVGNCWEWHGPIAPNGYGKTNVREPNRYRAGRLVHRFFFERLVFPIPEGLTLDHLCCNKICVNPSHLEPVTVGENVRRYTRKQTHCLRGHLLSEENLVPALLKTGRRACATCRVQYDHERYKRLRRSQRPYRGKF